MKNLLKLMFPIAMVDGEGNGGNGENDNWFDGLPEDVQGWDEVKNSDSPEKFWKQMGDMRSHLGQSLRIPGENASAEDHKAFNEKLLSKVPGLIPVPDIQSEESVAKFYDALGRPENADAYTVPKVNDKGIKLDNTPVDAFRPIAHKHGLSDAQFQGIVKDMTEQNVDAAVKSHTELQEQKTVLQNEWGLAYEQNMKKIYNVANNTGAPQPLLEALQAGNVDGATAKWLLGVANSFGKEGANLIEDKSEGILAPAQAKIEIAEIMNNKEHPYWVPSAAGHMDAKKHMQDLYKLAYPGQVENQTVGAG